MKLLQIYNQYRSLFGGEETVVRTISSLVEKNGGEARLLMKSSRGLDETLAGKTRAFVSGIYNPAACREVGRYLSTFQPEVAHVHNLYPLFSPSVLVALQRAGVPIVMTVHNHSHTCPRTDHLCGGRLCERCVGGREYNCVLHNCRRNMMESLGYALRSATARKLRLFIDNVTVTVALNDFARRRLITAGFPPDRVIVLPNMVDIPEIPADPIRGHYVVFSGRMCPRKGCFNSPRGGTESSRDSGTARWRRSNPRNAKGPGSSERHLRRAAFPGRGLQAVPRRAVSRVTPACCSRGVRWSFSRRWVTVCR